MNDSGGSDSENMEGQKEREEDLEAEKEEEDDMSASACNVSEYAINFFLGVALCSIYDSELYRGCLWSFLNTLVLYNFEWWYTCTVDVPILTCPNNNLVLK